MPTTQEFRDQTVRPVSRLGRNINLLIQLLLLLIVLLIINYLSSVWHTKFDLTERNDFTLSKTTKSYLRADEVQKRSSPLRIIALIKRTSPHYDRIYKLLTEYKRSSGDAMSLEFIDPLRQTDRALGVENTYKQPYYEDMIIIDANEDKLKGATSEKKETSAKLPAVHVRRILARDLYFADKNGSIISWKDEDVLTSEIIKALEGKPRHIYFIADKTNIETAPEDQSWTKLREIVQEQNILLIPLNLAQINKIPDDVEALALIAPQYDFDKREIKMLEEYWDRKKSAIFLTLDPKVSLNNLRVFLRAYGVTPRRDRIMSVQDNKTLSNVRCLFSQGSIVNQSLGGKSTIFDGLSSSLEVRENDERLINRHINPTPLIRALPEWWGETRYQVDKPEFNPEEDHAQPVYLAASILRGQAASDISSELTSKMVIISNNDFLRAGKTRLEQADFVKSCINWLVGRDALIGIGTKKHYRNKLTILPPHNTFISRLVLIFLPSIALLIGITVWNIRRS